MNAARYHCQKWENGSDPFSQFVVSIGTHNTYERADEKVGVSELPSENLGLTYILTKVVYHHTPSDQLDADEIGGASDDGDEIVALLLLKEADLVGNTARDVVNRIVLLVAIA